jgi:hypothetical protein
MRLLHPRFELFALVNLKNFAGKRLRTSPRLRRYEFKFPPEFLVVCAGVRRVCVSG